MTDRRAHLADPRLYRDFYEQDQQPGVIIPMFRGEPRLAFAAERIKPDDDVIDIGSHKGEMAMVIWSQTAGRTVAVDISHNALRHLRRLAEREDLYGLEVAQAFAEALPFADAAFDVALLCEILEHVVDVDSVVAEAERVVRDGGTIVVTVPRDALLTDEVDAIDRDKLTGMQLDMHVREFDPGDYFKDRPGLQVAWGHLKADDGNEMNCRMCSYVVQR